MHPVQSRYTAALARYVSTLEAIEATSKHELGEEPDHGAPDHVWNERMVNELEIEQRFGLPFVRSELFAAEEALLDWGLATLVPEELRPTFSGRRDRVQFRDRMLALFTKAA